LNLALFFIILSTLSAAVQAGEIVNNSYSKGQSKISAICSLKAENDISVQLKDDNNNPIAGAEVEFTIIKKPSKSEGAKIEREKVVTDSQGAAITQFTAGDKKGDYLILAVSAALPNKSALIIVSAQERSWLAFLIIGLLGGLALFIYGMQIMSDSLIKIGGAKLSGILSAFTSNRFSGVIVGTIVTAIIQSSSASTVMVVGFVNAGMMTL